MENIIVNKRGRKPKSQIISTLKTYNNLDTPIIAHLPIEYTDIIDQNDIFIRTDPNEQITKNKLSSQGLQFINLDSIESKFSVDKEIKILKNKIDELNAIIKKNDKLLNNKPTVQPLNSNNPSRCWWCSYYFNPIVCSLEKNVSVGCVDSSHTDINQIDLLPVELPEHYFNNMFYTNGKFCSYNCAMAYNIDLNDVNISK